jgi:hypothetical protein
MERAVRRCVRVVARVVLPGLEHVRWQGEREVG